MKEETYINTRNTARELLKMTAISMIGGVALTAALVVHLMFFPGKDKEREQLAAPDTIAPWQGWW